MKSDGRERIEPHLKVDGPAQVDGDALPNGSRLGEFAIEGVLGVGGFSIVYLAFDHSLHRHVAIKEYLPGAYAVRRGDQTITARSQQHEATFQAGLKSFVQEARLLAQFEHPALVKVLRFWEAHGTAYMAMPRYQGRTLRDILKADPGFATEPALKALIAPLLDAVEQLHAAQCFHRDISTDNIIVQPNGAPVLLDFGAARRIIADMTQALTVVLKHGFAPFEQYADSGAHQGPWTDIYALAAVLFAAITGNPPSAAVARVFNDPLQPLAREGRPGYSMQFLRGIDAGLAVRPEARPQSIQAFREALGLTEDDAQRTVAMTAVEQGEPTIVLGVERTVGSKLAGPETTPHITAQPAAGDRPPAALGPPSRSVSRAAWIAVAALLVAVPVGAYFWLFRPMQPPRVASAAHAPVAPEPHPAAPAAAASGAVPPVPVSTSLPIAASGQPPGSAAVQAPAPPVLPIDAGTQVEATKPPPAEPPRAPVREPAAPAPAPPSEPAPKASIRERNAARAEAAKPPARESASEPSNIAEAAARKAAKAKDARTDTKAPEKPAAPVATKAATPSPSAPIAAPPPSSPAPNAAPPSSPPANTNVAIATPNDPTRPALESAREPGELKDLSEEVRRYRLAADRGEATAQVQLGRAYATGNGAPRSDGDAVRWFRKAADAGNAEAYHYLGVMYASGRGVAKDPAEAARWYRKAADAGNALAQNNLGALYADGIGVAKDEAEAVKWYRKAAEQGNSSAQVNLGAMYALGHGLAKDEAAAVGWYRKAAEQGNARAQNNLAVMYGNGQGVAKDEAEAARWYRKAAEQGVGSAQFNLAIVYANGRGVMKDEAEAMRWFRKAAAQGYAPAVEHLKAVEASAAK